MIPCHRNKLLKSANTTVWRRHLSVN